MFQQFPGSRDESFVTTLTGSFYNKNRELVLFANSGEESEHIEVNAKCAFGFSGGGFGLVQGMTQEEIEFARIVLLTHGTIQEQISGHLDSKEIYLDGKVLINARLTRCKIYIKTGDFSQLGQNSFDEGQFFFTMLH
jgi:hypothetical protein